MVAWNAHSPALESIAPGQLAFGVQLAVVLVYVMVVLWVLQYFFGFTYLGQLFGYEGFYPKYAYNNYRTGSNNPNWYMGGKSAGVGGPMESTTFTTDQSISNVNGVNEIAGVIGSDTMGSTRIHDDTPSFDGRYRSDAAVQEQAALEQMGALDVV